MIYGDLLVLLLSFLFALHSNSKSSHCYPEGLRTQSDPLDPASYILGLQMFSLAWLVDQ